MIWATQFSTMGGRPMSLGLSTALLMSAIGRIQQQWSWQPYRRPQRQNGTFSGNFKLAKSPLRPNINSSSNNSNNNSDDPAANHRQEIVAVNAGMIFVGQS